MVVLLHPSIAAKAIMIDPGRLSTLAIFGGTKMQMLFRRHRPPRLPRSSRFSKAGPF